jgi:predicted NBD/HSP70 family sugar kinase
VSSDELVIALDVGGSSVKSALVTADRQILGTICVDAIQSAASAPEILRTLAAIVKGHLKKVKDVKGIGFAFPGPFDYGQGICLIQNLGKFDALYGLNITASLKEILGMPGLEIRYRNDAEAAILGEALYGAGAPYSRLLGLTLGTGLGSAFIAEGRLIPQGPDVPPHGWLYPFSYGTQRADDVFSTRGLLARLQERGIRATDIASAIQIAAENNVSLEEIFASFGTDLGEFLQPFVSAFRADALLITGGIAETWDRFAPSVIQPLSVPVLKGILGTRAALFGAVALYF